MATASYSNVIKTAGISTAFTDEAMTLVSGTTYQINDTTKRVWDRSVTPTFKDGINPIPASGISSIDYLFGKVTLVSTPTGAVTCSGNYLPMSEKTGFNTYTLRCSSNVGDSTTFDNNSGWTRRKQLLHDVALTLGGFKDPWFFGFVDCGKNTASLINATDDPVTFTMETGHGLTANSWIRIHDEVLRITTVATDTITATRAAWDTNKAEHAIGSDVFNMTASHYSRNAFMAEVRPGGGTTNIFRGWFRVDSQEWSGPVGDFEKNSVPLALDGEVGAAFGRGDA